MGLLVKAYGWHARLVHGLSFASFWTKNEKKKLGAPIDLVEMNPANIHEDVGLISGPALWIDAPVLPWAVV